eukprot:30511_3
MVSSMSPCGIWYYQEVETEMDRSVSGGGEAAAAIPSFQFGSRRPCETCRRFKHPQPRCPKVDKHCGACARVLVRWGSVEINFKIRQSNVFLRVFRTLSCVRQVWRIWRIRFNSC